MSTNRSVESQKGSLRCVFSIPTPTLVTLHAPFPSLRPPDFSCLETSLALLLQSRLSWAHPGVSLSPRRQGPEKPTPALALCLYVYMHI